MNKNIAELSDALIYGSGSILEEISKESARGFINTACLFTVVNIIGDGSVRFEAILEEERGEVALNLSDRSGYTENMRSDNEIYDLFYKEGFAADGALAYFDDYESRNKGASLMDMLTECLDISKCHYVLCSNTGIKEALRLNPGKYVFIDMGRTLDKALPCRMEMPCEKRDGGMGR